MAWKGDLTQQIEAEFRAAQRDRGAIVDRDAKPENVAEQVAKSINSSISGVRRRLVPAPSLPTGGPS